MLLKYYFCALCHFSRIFKNIKGHLVVKNETQIQLFFVCKVILCMEAQYSITTFYFISRLGDRKKKFLIVKKCYL